MGLTKNALSKTFGKADLNPLRSVLMMMASQACEQHAVVERGWFCISSTTPAEESAAGGFLVSNVKNCEVSVQKSWGKLLIFCRFYRLYWMFQRSGGHSETGFSWTLGRPSAKLVRPVLAYCLAGRDDIHTYAQVNLAKGEDQARQWTHRLYGQRASLGTRMW